MARVVPIDQLQPAFKNAMAHLYRENKLLTLGQTIRVWNNYFDCYLFHTWDFEWESVAFKDEEQQVMFVLKWS